MLTLYVPVSWTSNLVITLPTDALAPLGWSNKRPSTSQCHDDVIKWTHFTCYWPFVQGIHWSPVNSQHKGQWHGTLMFSLICTRIKDCVNKCEAGGLRRHRTHYGIIVMVMGELWGVCLEHFGENWPYNGTESYHLLKTIRLVPLAWAHGCKCLGMVY